MRHLKFIIPIFVLVGIFFYNRFDLRSLLRFTTSQKLSVFVGFRQHWDTAQIGTICDCDRGISVEISTRYGDPQVISKADFVIFVLDYRIRISIELWKELYRNKTLRQKWIYATRESPTTAIRLAPPYSLKSVFDWSFTYHSRATFSTPYGRYVPANLHMLPVGMANYADSKNKLISWTSSHCGTLVWKRKEFVLELSKYIGVDMYGACGNLTCPRGTNKQCEVIMNQYKFALALENSCCSEYITEKFWNAFRFNQVPIVFGASKEDFTKIAPPLSFIHMEDFKTMKELTEYILLVDSNDQLYNSYHVWRSYGNITRAKLPDDLVYSCTSQCRIATCYDDINKPFQDFNPFDDSWYGGCRNCQDVIKRFVPEKIVETTMI